MTMEYIRTMYNVPAKRGGRVIYSGDGTRRLGTIRSASAGYVFITLDGQKDSMPYHPTWKLTYLGKSEQ